jgi:hypothetical protein
MSMVDSDGMTLQDAAELFNNACRSVERASGKVDELRGDLEAARNAMHNAMKFRDEAEQALKVVAMRRPEHAQAEVTQ